MKFILIGTLALLTIQAIALCKSASRKMPNPFKHEG